ncbi:MAG: lipoyl synthase [Candidatus Firestonebacteria bacterium]
MTFHNVTNNIRNSCLPRQTDYLRLPYWLKKRFPANSEFNRTYNLIKKGKLNTVCESAKCPNIIECFSRKVATFLILGNICTRDCRFCNIICGVPLKVDNDEPKKILDAVLKLKLSYVVITSVTRDDLKDGGAGQFVQVMRELRKIHNLKIEVLTPDFKGNIRFIKQIVDENPDVFAHNVETVPRLYKLVRPSSNYNRSLEVLKIVKELNHSILTKSGFMLGLGETREEISGLPTHHQRVRGILSDLKRVKCDILTIGQYLRPSKNNISVQRFVPPEEFEEIKSDAEKIGFKFVLSGPFVRSSFKANSQLEEVNTAG